MAKTDVSIVIEENRYPKEGEEISFKNSNVVKDDVPITLSNNGLSNEKEIINIM